MKITIERAALLKALTHVQSVVEKRTTIPILSNVLMQASDGLLKLTATDLDIEASDAADATIVQAGAVTAPAHTLFEVVRKLPDGVDVHLSVLVGQSVLVIQAGRSRFELNTLPAGDFQPMGKDVEGAKFSLPTEALKRLIDKTRFAISTEETRYYLNGVYLHVADVEGGGHKVLRTVATDGHRLALAEIEAPAGSDGLPGVIVPRKAVQEVRRLLDSGEAEVEITASDAKIMFRVGRAVLTSKLIDGSFPDYARVIPKGNDRILRLDNKGFEKAVDRVATVSGERSRSVKLHLVEDTLKLSVTHSETGAGQEEMEVEYRASPLEIGFNARYLLDIAGQIEDATAVFELRDAASPALVRDPADPAARYVLMPLRV